MIFTAIEFATKAHRGQYRKGTRIPYIIHPLNVAKILIEQDCANEVVVAGLLHDTVEDTPVTLSDIHNAFGPTVTALVKASSEPDRSDMWENRKQHTLDFLKTAPREVLLISCADKLDNIRSMRQGYAALGEPFWDRFNRPKAKQTWYYQSLAQLFIQRIDDEGTKTLFTEFEDEVNKIFG